MNADKNLGASYHYAVIPAEAGIQGKRLVPGFRPSRE
jgi:hypothetical protein